MIQDFAKFVGNIIEGINTLLAFGQVRDVFGTQKGNAK